jgi:hypothetical protein
MGANGQGGGRHRPLAFVARIAAPDLEDQPDHLSLWCASRRSRRLPRYRMDAESADPAWLGDGEGITHPKAVVYFLR